MKLLIKACPSASKNKIEKTDEGHYKVSVTAPPIKGRANNMIVNLLAEHFHVPVSRVRIISGHTSSHKIIECI